MQRFREARTLDPHNAVSNSLPVGSAFCFNLLRSFRCFVLLASHNYRAFVLYYYSCEQNSHARLPLEPTAEHTEWDAHFTQSELSCRPYKGNFRIAACGAPAQHQNTGVNRKFARSSHGARLQRTPSQNGKNRTATRFSFGFCVSAEPMNIVRTLNRFRPI